MDDNSIISFGKHKGEKLIDVPASYLLWLWTNKNKAQEEKNPELFTYICDNLEVIRKEIAEKYRNYKDLNCILNRYRSKIKI